MSEAAFDHDKLYPVRVTAPVEIAGTKLWPGQTVDLRGDLVEEHRDAVEPVKESSAVVEPVEDHG